jgi:hypothetical protein
MHIQYNVYKNWKNGDKPTEKRRQNKDHTQKER